VPSKKKNQVVKKKEVPHPRGKTEPSKKETSPKTLSLRKNRGKARAKEKIARMKTKERGEGERKNPRMHRPSIPRRDEDESIDKQNLGRERGRSWRSTRLERGEDQWDAVSFPSEEKGSEV